MPPPSAYSAPQYYTPEQQAFNQQAPNMYMGNPINNGPPPVSVPPPNAPITPAVRKLDENEGESASEKKPRLDAEPEWQAPQIVSKKKQKGYEINY